MRFTPLLALSASLSIALAQIKGFNYGALFSDNSVKSAADFENEFRTARNLVGTSGFTSARLYTTVQPGTSNAPISAIEAAIRTQTSLLLGLWCSGGQASFDAELAAIRSAIAQYGSGFTDLVEGISVGSEDLYRISPTGVINLSGLGAGPSIIANYISQLRDAISGTPLDGKPVGHVDTWTAWVNGSNQEVIDASDFIGMNGFPYFQNTQANSIENGESLFFAAVDATQAAVGGKSVWITETGWPVSGSTEAQALPSVSNAETYWNDVGCRLFGSRNTWWYTLQDTKPITPNPSFGIVGSTLSTTPLYDLSCGNAPSESATSLMPSSTLSTVASPPPESSTQPTAPIETPSQSPPPAPQPSNPSSGKNCPANLSGPFEFPHLIVPVDSANPDKAYGTSYYGEVSSTISTAFNFDIPPSDAGKTCSLVFLLPIQDKASFTLSGSGSLSVESLNSPATQSTTFNSLQHGMDIGSASSVAPGNAYTIASGECPAGTTIGYLVEATESLSLRYFQDYNPAAPIGLYVTVC
ncbi:glycoside hydrolase family 17 protein [Aulographum hederae CBS 113979]|uniref:Probable glucan endo-1,3-beta-glucosidase eglC n=1 Tax=Aulographum hederae CBS 113979 TaxID=1176131 RepID=A0A6G1GNK7_9PEZI|nr:glycoside hydrolase family 17 protein [Aulographum hederae CBS 113979]